MPPGKFPEGPATRRFPGGSDPWSQFGEHGDRDLEGPLGVIDEARLEDPVLANAVLEAAGVYDEDFEDFLEAEGFCLDRGRSYPDAITGVVAETLADFRPGVWSLGVGEYLDRLAAIYDAVGVPNARFPLETGAGRSEALMVLTENWLSQNAGAKPNIERLLRVEANSARREIERYVNGEVFRAWVVTPEGGKFLCAGIYGEEEIEDRVRDMVGYLKNQGREAGPLAGAGLEP